ncbi:hypothetical protein BXZ70DRAFT_197169 [Cristinia sonorae]|uniref:BHLH domain-containing protein n=1 Tax=Cristinia sonorae TaxID=1940300 RepID=A0A8K0UN51_9AGAR|nr:hypothetical protein BXZ70DRAFT_197169 [Cristinia sonorae]
MLLKMSLLSPAESLAFNGFLSSVDYGDVLDTEWASLAAHLAPPRGKEALAKATKDLITLEPQLDRPSPTSTPQASRSASPSSPPPTASTSASADMQTVTATTAASASSQMNSWPTFSSSVDQSHHQQQHRYTYGFGLPTATSRIPGIYNNPFEPPLHIHTLAGHPPQLPLPYPHAHSESSLRHRPPQLLSPSSSSSLGHGFILPPLPDHAQQQHQMHSQQSYSQVDPMLQHRPSLPGSTTSAPSVLLQRSSSSAKRSFPQDNDSDTSSGTNTNANANMNMKRQRRPSTTPSLGSTTPETPSQAQPPTNAAGQGQRQALLSPSQKRANHIQSEQKRRANIRRGYEALCEVVPALREAIRAEEESLAAAEEKANSKSRGGGGGSRKKGKGKAKAEDCPGGPGGLDGRAGPRSENVVLQQTIDHLQGLLSERQTLLQRLAFAQSTLSARDPNHPALRISPEHLVGFATGSNGDGGGGGVALWEREWTGGTGWGGDEDADE